MPTRYQRPVAVNSSSRAHAVGARRFACRRMVTGQREKAEGIQPIWLTNPLDENVGDASDALDDRWRSIPAGFLRLLG